MKIGNPLDKPGLTPLGKPASPAAKSASTPETAAGAAATSSSTVALSKAATALLRGSEAPQEASSDFDSAKVDRISDAISRGQFTVNAEVIADKLLANAHELLGPSH